MASSRMMRRLRLRLHVVDVHSRLIRISRRRPPGLEDDVHLCIDQTCSCSVIYGFGGESEVGIGVDEKGRLRLPVVFEDWTDDRPTVAVVESTVGGGFGDGEDAEGVGVETWMRRPAAEIVAERECNERRRREIRIRSPVVRISLPT
ncbi:hypothetical protein QJS04_geneDACA012896 [Acorus gramineus]|uniref:Uncharacterized protein n=1 Tax=Acorus gramineus TaxID=55184 RepID=A0AAV9BFB7_ACOGR|nr:hypothetical protein QJS04_geneDACA012896 [Acorus gramineus]